MQLSSGLHYRSFRTCKIIRFVKALGYRGKSRRFGSYTLQAAIAAVMRRRNRSLQPTGGRLLRFTTDWYEFSLRRLYSSIVPWQLPCATVQRPVWRMSTRCWNMANWPIITWRIPPVPICTAGSAGRRGSILL